jgi:hypothetical protein
VVTELVFQEFPKIARLNRECIITEKIDGTNACVVVTETGEVAAQSRNNILLNTGDSFGFALWVERNKDRLRDLLGPGHHFGEWWGSGIQRGYAIPADAPQGRPKRLSLFNVDRWADLPESPDLGTVPVLYRGLFNTAAVESAIAELRANGSKAAPGYMKPEGVVVFHVAANMGFKVTLEKDEEHKGGKR